MIPSILEPCCDIVTRNQPTYRLKLDTVISAIPMEFPLAVVSCAGQTVALLYRYVTHIPEGRFLSSFALGAGIAQYTPRLR